MTVSNFRLLLILSLILGVLGGVLDLLFPGLLPEVYRNAQQTQDELLLAQDSLWLSLYALLSVLLIIPTIYGLYFFRSWAPSLAVAGTSLSLVFCVCMGAMVQSGLALAFSSLFAYLWGAVIVSCYVSPLRDRFAKH